MSDETEIAFQLAHTSHRPLVDDDRVADLCQNGRREGRLCNDARRRENLR